MENKMIDTEALKAVFVPVAATAAIGTVLGLVVVLSVLGGIAVALGVGLGVGLSRNSGFVNANTAATSATGAGTSNISCAVNGQPQCGCTYVTPSITGLTRISQSVDAVPNSWPWVVIITGDSINNTAGRCSGFLVDFRHVVTYTRCLFSADPGTFNAYFNNTAFTIRAGATTVNPATGETRSSQAIYIITPTVANVSGGDGLTVIRLASAFTYSTTINTCCLSKDTIAPTVGTQGIVAGWGITATGQAQGSNTLRQAVVTATKCVTSYDDSFCTNTAEGQPQGCAGDAGGPYMTRSGSVWSCLGVIDERTGCPAADNIHIFYVSTGYYRTQITDALTAANP